MAKCLYCKSFIEKGKHFCNDKCKEKYDNVIDSLIPRIKGDKGLTPKEIQLQQEFLKAQSAKG